MPCFWTTGTRCSSVPRASNPQSHRTSSSVALASSLIYRDLLDGETLSPAVPVRVAPGGDLRSALEELPEELLDARVARECLRLLRGLPDVDAQEIVGVHRVQKHLVRDVAGLPGHLLGRSGHLVVDRLHGSLVALEPGPDHDCHCHGAGL